MALPPVTSSGGCSDGGTWWPIIRDLRQDQELISERWQAARRHYNQLNGACDEMVQSLWMVHALQFALNKVLSHRSPPTDWITARDESAATCFVNAAQMVSPDLQESYSRFLGNLRDHPEVVAELLKWAGQEGLDTAHLSYDLVSVVYGHCLFQEDHTLLLESICHLLVDHIEQCTSVKEMFSIEPVCSRVITEYCQQIVSLKVFLAQVLSDPLKSVLGYSQGYLEYDIAKASTRLQGQERFDVSDYVESSSKFLAERCVQFLMALNKNQNLFPSSLQWLLGRLKQSILRKWPQLTTSALRRPISYVLFGFIISSAFVNPDLMGVLDVRIVLNDVAWYNISQVIGVLQGCAWIVDKLETSQYPMRRVVKYMDMIPFNALIDSIDNGLGEGPPPVVSMLPGLSRTSHLFSLNQLQNIVGTVYDACNAFMFQNEVKPVQLEVSKAISVIPDAVILKDRRNPYSFSVTSLHQVTLSSPSKEEYSGKSPKIKQKQRAKSVWGGAARLDKVPPTSQEAKSLTLSTNRVMTKSSSNSNVAAIISPMSPSTSGDFTAVLPREVLVLPIWKPAEPCVPVNSSWNIQLMSEEEFIRDRFSVGTAAIDPSNSLLATAAVAAVSSSVNRTASVSNNSPELLARGKSFDTSLPQCPSSSSIELISLNTTEPPVKVAINYEELELKEKSNGFALKADNTETTDNAKEDNREGSWSPETYDGSVSDEDDKIFDTPLTKSCEPFTNYAIDRPASHTDRTLSTSVPQSKRGLKAWLGKKMARSKKKNNNSIEVEEPDLTNRTRVESYTKRIGHITAKYEQLSREKRASEPRHVHQSPSSGAASLSSREWQTLSQQSHRTLEDFHSSPLYQQLKYKLTILLQRVHTSHVDTMGEIDDIKDQLLEILEAIEYSSQWRDDYSERGVLSEVIGQLKSLDSICVKALLEGVRENHQAHLEYLRYLSTVQRQCCDACLQVNALQGMLDRSRQLQVDSFLNFTIGSFFEERSAKLEQVKRDLENCSTADEKCALVQDCRDTFKTALEKDSHWQFWSGGDLEQVHSMIDDHIFSHLYKFIFHPNGESDRQRDEVFHKHIESISQSVTPEHPLLKIPPIYFSSYPWTQVQDLLTAMSIYKSPQAKLLCITRACQLLIRQLQLARCGDPPGADDTFPVLVFVLIRANPVSLLSTEQYVKVFCEDHTTGETAYWWTQFCSAIGFLRTPEFTQQ